MPKSKSHILYEKILRDVNRHISGSDTIVYTDSSGIKTETTFRIPPSPHELEGLLIWLNKEYIAQA